MCGICLEVYQNPRALPCRHSYCINSLRKHISTTRTASGTVRCPQCRKLHTMPDGGVQQFPKKLVFEPQVEKMRRSDIIKPFSNTVLASYIASSPENFSFNNCENGHQDNRKRDFVQSHVLAFKETNDSCKLHPFTKVESICRTCTM